MTREEIIRALDISTERLRLLLASVVVFAGRMIEESRPDMNSTPSAGHFLSD